MIEPKQKPPTNTLDIKALRRKVWEQGDRIERLRSDLADCRKQAKDNVSVEAMSELRALKRREAVHKAIIASQGRQLERLGYVDTSVTLNDKLELYKVYSCEITGADYSETYEAGLRLHPCVIARSLYVYYRLLNGTTLTKVGEELGKDHSTISHLRDRVIPKIDSQLVEDYVNKCNHAV